MAEETKVEEKVEEKTEATAAPAEETKAEEVKPNPLQRTIELTIPRFPSRPCSCRYGQSRLWSGNSV